jgi:hypothetical protein
MPIVLSACLHICRHFSCTYLAEPLHLHGCINRPPSESYVTLGAAPKMPPSSEGEPGWKVGSMVSRQMRQVRGFHVFCFFRLPLPADPAGGGDVVGVGPLPALEDALCALCFGSERGSRLRRKGSPGGHAPGRLGSDESMDGVGDGRRRAIERR